MNKKIAELKKEIERIKKRLVRGELGIEKSREIIVEGSMKEAKLEGIKTGLQIAQEEVDDLKKNLKRFKQEGIIGDLSKEGLLDYKGTMTNLKEFQQRLKDLEDEVK